MDLRFYLSMAKNNSNSKKQLENLARRLRELRIEKGYSNYEQFAFDNEIPRAQYGRYEKGSDLRFSSLVKVLDALEISLEDFFSKGFD